MDGEENYLDIDTAKDRLAGWNFADDGSAFYRTADRSTLRLHLAHHLAVLLRTRGHKPSAPSHHGNLMHQLHPR